MAQPQKNQALRTIARALDFSARRHVSLLIDRRGIPRQRPSRPEGNGFIQCRTADQQSARFRALSLNVPRIHDQVRSQALTVQGAARRDAKDAEASCPLHAQEPNPKPSGAAVYRLRPRDCKAVGEEKIALTYTAPPLLAHRRGNRAELGRNHRRDHSRSPSAPAFTLAQVVFPPAAAMPACAVLSPVLTEE